MNRRRAILKHVHTKTTFVQNGIVVIYFLGRVYAIQELKYSGSKKWEI